MLSFKNVLARLSSEFFARFAVLIVSLISFVGVLPGAHAAGRSAKKLAADHNPLSAPQVLEAGDSLVGLRSLDSAGFGGNVALGLSYEKMVRPNFGFSLQVFNSSYSTKYSVGPLAGRWDYSVWTFDLLGNFHADLLGVRNLDTFVSGGVGRSILTSKWTSSSDLPAPANTETSRTFLMASLNARYFIDSKWSFLISAGTGAGTFGFGADYLF
jgi:hypothetical protein